MLLKNSEIPLKIKFSDETLQKIFIGVAGDNQSRVLEVTILDSDNNIYKEDIPSLKILAKGDLDKKVYYNVGTKKTAGVYTVGIPSQVFKQSQNVEIQFLIENEETHERIFSTMIKQRVQRGFCANFEEGTNIYLDYEEILKFEENFKELATEETSKAVAELELQIENSKSGILEEISDFIKSQKNTTLAEIEYESTEKISKIRASGDEAVARVETATNEAIKAIDNKIAEIDMDRIMARLDNLEALIVGLDDRIKANEEAIVVHTGEIKEINDNILVHQTTIDTVTDDLNKKI